MRVEGTGISGGESYTVRGICYIIRTLSNVDVPAKSTNAPRLATDVTRAINTNCLFISQMTLLGIIGLVNWYWVWKVDASCATIYRDSAIREIFAPILRLLLFLPDSAVCIRFLEFSCG
jgi:hypothetical protein